METPQVFDRDLLCEAYELVLRDGRARDRRGFRRAASRGQRVRDGESLSEHEDHAPAGPPARGASAAGAAGAPVNGDPQILPKACRPGPVGSPISLSQRTRATTEVALPSTASASHSRQSAHQQRPHRAVIRRTGSTKPSDSAQRVALSLQSLSHPTASTMTSRSSLHRPVSRVKHASWSLLLFASPRRCRTCGRRRFRIRALSGQLRVLPGLMPTVDGHHRLDGEPHQPGRA